MILAIDIGNTNINIGSFDEDNILFLERASTDIRKTELEYAVLIKTILEILEIKASEISGAIISSVVPSLVHTIKVALRKLINCDPLVVGPGIKTGLNIRLDNPAQIGADFVAESVAAIKKYGAPVIIIDMGTATTFAVINKDNEYLGGAIYPGVVVSMDALVSRTSLLPTISFGKPKKCIGSNTIDAMKSGIIYGEAAKLDGLIDRFEEELGYECKVIATGGLSKVVVPNCRHNIVLDNDLILIGLKILYDKNTR